MHLKVKFDDFVKVIEEDEEIKLELKKIIDDILYSIR